MRSVKSHHPVKLEASVPGLQCKAVSPHKKSRHGDVHLRKPRCSSVKREAQEHSTRRRRSSPAVKTEPEEPQELEVIKSEPQVVKQEFLGDLDIHSLKLLAGFTIQAEKDHWQIPAPVSKRKPKLRYRPPNGTVLNISNVDFSSPLGDQIELKDVSFLHHAITYSKKMVMVIGAGVSVGSGIPDFRSAHGLFQGFATKSDGSGKNLFDYNLFRSNESIKKFEAMIETIYNMSVDCKPSLFHHMIDQVSSQDRLLRLYTQNIDCLDTQLPSLHTKIPLTFKKPYPRCVQLHGSVKLLSCSKCKYVEPLTQEFFEKPPNEQGRRLVVRCPECQELNMVRQVAGKRLQNEGVLRPRIVLYNEFHPDGDIIGNITETDLKSRPDCLIVAGTTLKIPGVRRLVKAMARAVHANNGYVIWVNLEEPTQSIVDYVEYFDLLVVGDCQLIPGLVKLYDYVYKPSSKGKAAQTFIPSQQKVAC